MFKLLKTHDSARLGELTTAHGTVKTPCFMNVATQAAIKGGLSADDLMSVGCQIALANTYHLHLRPSEDVINVGGGLHGFMRWNKPILTDSGGFQIYSLAKIRKISEDGATFQSHIDGRRIFMSPEDSIRIQFTLGSDIAMAFDECIGLPAPREYVKQSCDRTFRWLERCKAEAARLTDVSDGAAYTALFGINQGATFADLRVEHMARLAELDLPGYAIGGLAVGETAAEMYATLDALLPHMPTDKPRYLMGVGTPENIREAVKRGVDMFDCVLPARNGRHGKFYTAEGTLNIKNERFTDDHNVLDDHCGCPVCTGGYSRAYVRHLFKSGEILGLRFAVLHNLWYFNNLLATIRGEIENA